MPEKEISIALDDTTQSAASVNGEQDLKKVLETEVLDI